jgi:lactate racemase
LIKNSIYYPDKVNIFKPKVDRFELLQKSGMIDKLQNHNLLRIINETRTLLIINDSHRSTPTNEITNLLLPLTNKIESVIIATGSHKSPTEDELKFLIQGKLKDLEIKIHDAHLPLASYNYYGETTRGTPVYLNKIIEEYETILCLNSVEPHYFAGVTGGMKSIIPGLAALKSIEANHSWALDPNSGPLITNGNPLFEDLFEVATKLKQNLIGIQLINVGESIIDIFFDYLFESQRQAIDRAKEVFSYILQEKFHLIVSIVESPLNRSIYQAQKGLENTRQVLVENGIIVLVATAEDGIGSNYFFKTLSKFQNQEQVLASLSRENYKFGDHKAQKFASLTQSHSLYIVGGITVEEAEKLFASKLSNEELNQMIESYVFDQKKIAICHDAGMVVLISKQ